MEDLDESEEYSIRSRRRRQPKKHKTLKHTAADIVTYQQSSSKTFIGIPEEWHQTIKVRNPDT